MGLKDMFNTLFGSKNDSECLKILGMLDSILDEEANQSEVKRFQQHVENCMPCYEKYNLDKTVKELLRRRCNDSKAPAELVESIRVRVNESNKA